MKSRILNLTHAIIEGSTQSFFYSLRFNLRFAVFSNSLQSIIFFHLLVWEVMGETSMFQNNLWKSTVMCYESAQN